MARRCSTRTWGEQLVFGPDNVLKLSMLCQGLDEAAAKAVWRPFFDWVAAAPQDFALSPGHGVACCRRGASGTSRAIPSWSPIRARARPNIMAGGAAIRTRRAPSCMATKSLWLPASLLQDAERERLADALFAASRHKKVELHFNKGLAGAPDEAIAAARDTATNPAMTEAFALAIIADGEAPRYPGLPRPALDVAAARRNAEAIDAAAAELRQHRP